jgi:hypothetical protein
MVIFLLLFMGSNFFLGKILLFNINLIFEVCFRHEVREIYPNKYITGDDRIYVFYTLFSLPGKNKRQNRIENKLFSFRNLSYWLFD